MGVVLRIFDGALGSASESETVFRHELKLVSDRISARDLIARRVAVALESQAQERETADAAGKAKPSDPPLDFWALATEVDTASPLYGVPRPGPVPPVSPPTPEDAAARAISAFERGAFLLFVGDRQITDLHEKVGLSATQDVTFFRIMPLRGG